jgi:sensor histidine kinase YesM
MRIAISTYWKCQLIGWTIWTIVLYLIISLSNPGGSDFMLRAVILGLFGLAVSHFGRFIIKRFRILDKTLMIQIISMLFVIIVIGFFAILLINWVLDVTGIGDKIRSRSPNSFKPSFFRSVIYDYAQSLLLMISWTAVYFLAHYIPRIKKTEQEKAALRIILMESEVQALRVQMNPQFIFNGMNTIKSYISKNENDKAANYLTTFSKLIRTLFQNSDKREVSLYEELETCKLYTQLERMRFGDKVEFIFDVDETIDLKDSKVPALILQPFIENAIWHGLIPKESGGKVTISVTKNKGAIQCVIDDNGIGREQSKQFKPQYESTYQSKGIGLTQSRLELDKVLNEREDAIYMIDKEDENGKPEGTKVIIKFKENRK